MTLSVQTSNITQNVLVVQNARILLICKAIIYHCTLHSLFEGKVLCYHLAVNVGDPVV